MRLNKYLAKCGLGSRRKVEELILDGVIIINGEKCRDLAYTVDVENDEIRYLGKKLKLPESDFYLILNKPSGYVVSQSDEFRRNTVYDLLPANFKSLPYAGRLDKASEGLLLFSSDGELIRRLTHPSFKIEKTYKLRVAPPLRKAQIESLRSGVEIEGRMSLPAKVYVKSKSDESMELRIIITEGRKRQIRNMITAVGSSVKNLRRVQFGTIKLDDLPVGRWRPLLDEEVRALYRSVELKQNKKI